jgi:hypothetical protein
MDLLSLQTWEEPADCAAAPPIVSRAAETKPLFVAFADYTPDLKSSYPGQVNPVHSANPSGTGTVDIPTGRIGVRPDLLGE